VDVHSSIAAYSLETVELPYLRFKLMIASALLSASLKTIDLAPLAFTSERHKKRYPLASDPPISLIKAS
jgi:hypothetical protein